MRRWRNLLVVAACLAVATLPLIPPSAESDQFSTSRAMGHITEIARAPHPMGSGENARVRSYLASQLTALGLSPQIQNFEVMDYFGAPGNTVEAANVMARLEGTGQGRALALVAHYDTVPETPGANDNSASVAIVLEVAATLADEEPPENDVIFLFTDGEEPEPRFGSSAFVDDHPWFGDVAFVINLEASGSSGDSILAEISGSSTWLIDLVDSSAPYPIAFSVFTEIASAIGGFGTDFDPFREQGIPGLAFAYLHGSPVYHTAQDSIENVDVKSVHMQGSNTLALTRLLADADLSPPPDASDSVFFSVGRWTVVRYPTALSILLALSSLVVFGFGVVRDRTAGLFKGLAVASGAFLGAAMAGALVWSLVAMVRTTPSVTESYLWLCGLLVVTGGLWVTVARRFDTDRLFVGVVGLWVLFALATALFIPGVSYLFGFPALAGSIAVLVRPHAPALMIFVVSLFSLVVAVPVVDILFQLAQPRPGNPDSNLIPVAGAATAIALLAFGLIHSTWRCSEGANEEDTLQTISPPVGASAQRP